MLAQTSQQTECQAAGAIKTSILREYLAPFLKQVVECLQQVDRHSLARMGGGIGPDRRNAPANGGGAATGRCISARLARCRRGPVGGAITAAVIARSIHERFHEYRPRPLSGQPIGG